MALGFDLAAVALAFGLTIIELTEVVALVFALGADGGALRPAAQGAIAGVVVVGAVAGVAGAALAALPSRPLLLGSAVVLAAFGLFLLRSTVRTYRKARGVPSPHHASTSTAPFAGGFTVGAVETTEVVIVLVALAAGGAGASALLGALAAGAVLVGLAVAVHERVRRIKVPTLKLGATSALFAFAAFWGGEAVGGVWPGTGAWQDVWLLPLFVVSLLLVRAGLSLDAHRIPGPAPTGGSPGP